MIGAFDSGLGGLSVVGHIQRRLPEADVHFVGDRARAPYGTRPSEDVRSFSTEIAGYLIGHGAQMIVVACNTASAAALGHLRSDFPTIPFVGMEPAVKPAATNTSSGVVGVVATAGTLDGPLFEDVVTRFGRDATIIAAACPRWVELVESGVTSGPAVVDAIADCLEPLLARGADRIVLACTHFPILLDTIRSVVGERAEIVDPGPAVAEQTARVATRIGADVGTSEMLVELTGSELGARTIAERAGLLRATIAVVSSLE